MAVDRTLNRSNGFELRVPEPFVDRMRHGDPADPLLLQVLPMLAERMKAHGYNTHMVTANVATTHIFGLDRGFDSIDRIWQDVPAVYQKIHQVLVLVGKPRLRKRIFSKDFVVGKLSEDIEASKTWLQSTMDAVFNRSRALLDTNTARGEGSFLFLNLMETHFPYHIDDTFKCLSEGPWAKIRELYNLYHLVNQTWLTRESGEIPAHMLNLLRERQRMDWQRMAPVIDEFMRELREKYDATVVFCSDHGDNFGEQGWQYHFSNVTDAGNRVPLLWLDHEQDAGRMEDTAVSARDIYGTILRSVGDPDPSLLSLLEAPQESVPVLQSYWYNNRGKTLPQYRHNQIAFVVGDQRYAFRHNRWYSAPVTQADQPEPAFELLDPGVNPLEEALEGAQRMAALRETFAEFLSFSDQVMNQAA